MKLIKLYFWNYKLYIIMEYIYVNLKIYPLNFDNLVGAILVLVI